MKNYVGVEPQVAMLSFSTKGSSKHEMVDKVKQATEIAKCKCEYAIDGEMQADSALDFSTSQKKGITSSVGGNANVLVFPDLDAGNIGYKIAERLGGFMAVGPICQGFAKPLNDLSRGCKSDDIVAAVAITVLQTQL
jgi:phosphate acetyltransferase